MIRERFARGTLAGEGRHIRGLGHRHLGGNLVLGGRAFQFLELQLDLIKQPGRAFRARPVELARQLLDPQLLMSDQGLIIRGLGLRYRKLRFGARRPGGFSDALITLSDQCRLQRCDIVRNCTAARIHATNRITNLGG